MQHRSKRMPDTGATVTGTPCLFCVKILSSVPCHTDVEDPFLFKGFVVQPELVDRIKAKCVCSVGCRVCSNTSSA